MRYFAGLVVPTLLYLVGFSSCHEAEAKDKDLSEAEENVFEDTFSQAEVQKREKLKSLGFHEQVSFDSFHQFLDRVKRAAKSRKYKGKRSFFKLLTDAFAVVYGRKREVASLGKEDDLPTEILEGALSFKPDIFNPLQQKIDFRAGSRGINRNYLSNLKKEPPSLPYRHNLRKEDKPGCGPPICSIIDMRVKTFKSMCHMVEYLIQNGRYRTIFDVQKGSCEEAIKDRSGRGKWSRRRWLLKSPKVCTRCEEDDAKVCGQPICVNDNGHAKSFKSVCEAMKYLKSKRRLKSISFGLGECKALYSNCQNTEYFDLDDPTDGTESESVGAVYRYLKGLDPKNVHRSCPMNHIHYPTDIRTREGQIEVSESMYKKQPHQITCHNKANIGNKPGPPFYWKKDSVTCRDWKMKYCCENLWGMPGNYSLVAGVAEGSVPKAVSEKTDVLVDPPLKKHLFEDCTWQQFVGFPLEYNTRSDMDSITRIAKQTAGKYLSALCGLDAGRAMYIDARAMPSRSQGNKQLPWDETGDVLTKVSPHYGVYCDVKNNAQAKKGRRGGGCLDYKFRLCCAKKYGRYTQWSEWSACLPQEVEYGANAGANARKLPCGEGVRKRSRKCNHPRGCGENSKEKLNPLHEFKPCFEPCKEDIKWDDWTAWSTCSKTCGPGTSIRRRYCTDGTQGYNCPKPSEAEERVCTKCPCPKYSVTPWEEWGPCTEGCMQSKSNSPSVKTRARFCVDESIGFVKVDNAKCAHLAKNFVDKEDCAAEACPRDGGWTPWQEWEQCDQDCGEGTQIRKRFCGNPTPIPPGKKCRGNDKQRRKCLLKKCPVHCEMSEWGEWSACFQKCAPNGDISLTDRCRFRHINQKPEGGGVECGETKEHSECPLCNIEGNEMPINESKLARPNYEQKPNKIYGSKQPKGYEHQPKEIYGSKRAKGYEQQPNEIYGSKQPKGYESDEAYDENYSDYNSGNDPIDTSHLRGKRKTMARPNYEKKSNKIYGSKLPKGYEQQPKQIYGSKPPKGYEQQPNEMYGSKQPKGYEPPKHCIKQCPVDCVMSDWTTWSSSVTCNCGSSYRGWKHRTRQPIIYPAYDGKPCLDTDGQELPNNYQREKIQCTEGDIKVVCAGQHKRALGLWSQWSNCLNECGDEVGERVRHRQCNDKTKCGNKKLTESQKCPAQCNTNTFGAWTRWSQCTKTCGVGTMSRQRNCKGNKYGACNGKKIYRTRMNCDMGACGSVSLPANKTYDNYASQEFRYQEEL